MGVYWIPIVFFLFCALLIWNTSRRMGMTWLEWKAVFIEIFEVGKEITWRDVYRIFVYEVFGGPGGIILAVFIGFVLGFTVALHVIL